MHMRRRQAEPLPAGCWFVRNNVRMASHTASRGGLLPRTESRQMAEIGTKLPDIGNLARLRRRGRALGKVSTPMGFPAESAALSFPAGCACGVMDAAR
jgi:hypothetical protein